MKKEGHAKVRSRNETFTQKPVTKIWLEQPSSENPYVAEDCYCHGYNLLELMQNRRFSDVLYLLFKGDLPSAEKSELLEHLLIALINPGPRHPSARAAMCAGVGKTDSAHILPISLGILGGTHLGGTEVEESMRFLRKNLKNVPEQVVESLLEQTSPPEQGDWHLAPGFGCRYGGVDIMANKIALSLSSLPGAGKALQWGTAFAESLCSYKQGWLPTGLAAAVFSDLGLHPRTAVGLFQLLCSPGLLAHGLELSNKPITALPFIKDEEYTIER